MINNVLEGIDKRLNGGCLWAIGGNEFANIFKDLSVKGVKFSYAEKGVRVTGHKPA